MAFITFLEQWDRFNPGETRMIEPTLAARLIQSGIAKPFERQYPVQSDNPPMIVQENEKPIKAVKPKPKRSDKRLKPSRTKGK